MPPGPSRAAPLPAEDRRRDIARAVVPLLAVHGAAVTSKQMAAAAGVSEGTLFKVFDDKCAIIHAAIKVSMEPEPITSSLREIHAAAPLPIQLAEAARILLDRSERAWTLLSVLRSLPPAAGREAPSFIAESTAVVTAALTELFEPHSAQLRVEPRKAAAAFRSLLYASRHPFIDVRERLSIDEIVDIVLAGVSQPDVGATR